VEYSMLEIVRESLLPLLPGQFEILPAFFGRFVILITFNGPVTTRDHYRQVCRQIEKRLEEPLSNYLKLQLAIAASPPFSELHKLKAVYQKTARQMIYRFYYERPRIIHAEDCFPLQPLSREDAVWLNGLAAQTASDPNPKTLQRFLNKAKTFFLQMKQQPGDVTDWLTELKTIFVNDSHLPPWPDFREAGS
ncbi:DUF4085 domain-containing protein, partial [Paenibacillus sepulcri]|nr:DUF4085 domain-containing protein [Paenibacillus sepulcri]